MVDETAASGLSRCETSAVIALGSMATLAPPLQPLLLGQLAAEGQISLVQIGQVAMMEGLGMAIVASIAGARMRPERLRLVAGLALAAMAMVNLATAHLSGIALLGARVIAGMGTGALSWIWIGLLARHPVPARLCAIFILIQSSTLVLLSSLFSAWLFEVGGARAGYMMLAAINGMSLVAAALLPRRYPVAVAGIEPALPRGRGLAGLASLSLFFAGIMALWVYVVPLAILAGLGAGVGRSAISIGLAAQLAAGLAAGFFAMRLDASKVVGGGVLAAIALASCLGTTQNEMLFSAAVICVAFLWVFAGSFQMPYLTRIDPSRRAAMQLSPAVLLGMAGGPAVASIIVARYGMAAVMTASLRMLVASLVLVLATLAAQRRTDGAIRALPAPVDGVPIDNLRLGRAEP